MGIFQGLGALQGMALPATVIYLSPGRRGWWAVPGAAAFFAQTLCTRNPPGLHCQLCMYANRARSTFAFADCVCTREAPGLRAFLPRPCVRETRPAYMRNRQLYMYEERARPT